MQPTLPERAHGGRQLVGVFGVLTGILAIASTLVVFYTPVPSRVNVLSTYEDNLGLFWAGLIIAMVSAAVGIPFIAGLGQVLSHRSSMIADGAVLLVVASILLRLVAAMFEVVGLFAVSQGPTGGIYSASATVQASFTYQVGTLGASLAYPILGVGLILIGWLALRNPLFPRWFAVLTALGGVAGLAAPASIYLVLIEIVVVVLSSLGAGLLLWAMPENTIRESASTG